MSSATYRLAHIHRSLADSISFETSRRLPDSLTLLRLKKLRLAVEVTRMEDNEVELEIASGTRIRVVKGLISDVRPHATKPAND